MRKTSGGTRRTQRATQSAPATARPPAAADAASGPDNAAFQRAILKIALELRKPGAAGYDAIVEQTIRSMRLDAHAFRRFLGGNGAQGMNLLLATARGGGS